MAQLNIKDPEVYRMAQELARRRGTTATGAIRDILTEALAADRPPPSDLRDRTLQLVAKSEELDEPFPTDEQLYDADGLPR